MTARSVEAPGGAFDFGADTLRRFLERVSDEEPAPGGGAAAAVSAALAAGLVAMAGRFSPRHLDDRETLIAEADQLRVDALRLATEDAEAYGAVLAAYRLSKDTADRPARIRVALTRATEVPLAVAELGAAVTSLASLVAAKGNPNLQGDALIAVILAEAATRSAARLVELNVRLGGLEQQWLAQASDHVSTAAAALGLVTSPS